MSNALAKIDTTSILVSGDFDDMKQKAQTMIRSGLLPYSIKTPEQFIVIAFHAVELGLPVMYAMRHITVINGNPTADAQAMSGIIEDHFGDNAIVVTEQSPKQATVKVMKPGWKEPQFVTYTMEEAVSGKVNMSWDKDKKQWVEKHAWKSHPTDMLRSRAVSRAARTYFPASIGGLYTPEELGADVEITPDGEMKVIDVTPHPDNADARPVQPAQIVDTTTGEILDPWDKPDAQPVPAKMSDEALEQMSQAIRGTETPEQTADLYELYLDDGDMHEDNAEFLKVETQVRFYEFLTAATSKDDLDAIGAALKQTGIGTDGLRKEFAKAKARIMEPEVVTA